MSKYTQESKDALWKSLDIIDIFNKILDDKSSNNGAYKWYKCPLCDELYYQTLVVDKKSEKYHCFECEESGDLMEFLKKLKGFETQEEDYEYLAELFDFKLERVKEEKPTHSAKQLAFHKIMRGMAELDKLIKDN